MSYINKHLMVDTGGTQFNVSTSMLLTNHSANMEGVVLVLYNITATCTDTAGGGGKHGMLFLLEVSMRQVAFSVMQDGMYSFGANDSIFLA